MSHLIVNILSYIIALFMLFAVPIIIVLIFTYFIDKILKYFFNTDEYKLKIITSTNTNIIKNNKNNIENTNILHKYWNQFSNATVSYSFLEILVYLLKRHINFTKFFTKYTKFSSEMLNILINSFYLVFFDAFIILKFSQYQWTIHKDNKTTRTMNILIVATLIITISIIIIKLSK